MSKGGGMKDLKRSSKGKCVSFPAKCLDPDFPQTAQTTQKHKINSADADDTKTYTTPRHKISIQNVKYTNTRQKYRHKT